MKCQQEDDAVVQNRFRSGQPDPYLADLASVADDSPVIYHQASCYAAEYNHVRIVADDQIHTVDGVPLWGQTKGDNEIPTD
ncbi:MAG: hypothetical protein KF893_01340 [Caldilineaceae bacterium]|nr:hypothetical protein [Caldilineaceae bacterium]